LNRVPRLSILIAVILACLAVSASAQAQVTIGQLAPTNPLANCHHSSEYDEVQVKVSSGASYVVPAPGGVLTSWSTNAAAGAGQTMGLKIFRPAALGTFTILAHDGPRPLAPSVLNTFAVDIPVQAGDVIGIHNPVTEVINDACSFETANAGDELFYEGGDLADGAAFGLTSNDETESRINISATVLPPPSIGAIAPASGSLQGGTSVAITGSNFADVKAVSFGAAPATSFIVNSESQITAIAPASASLTAVPIAVTTIAGTASSPSTFAYQGCLVPKLNGKKLKASKKKAKAADCKIGKVTKKEGATAKTGKVKKQSPKAGKILAPGTQVKVTLKP
jgi:IPT/TIG domain-containing protein/PASTA domain-containing protein